MQFINSFRSLSTSRWSFERASQVTFFLTLFLAAIIFIPLPAVPFFPLKVFVLVLGSVLTVIFYALARLTAGNFTAPPLLLLGALWLVPIAYGLSVLFSSAPASRSIFENFQTDTFGFMVLVSVLGTLAALVLRRREHFRSFFRIAACLFGVVLVGQMVLFVIGYVDPTLINANLSLIGSFTDLTMFSGLGLVAALIAFRFVEFSRQKAYALGVVGVLALFVLALSNNLVTWVLVGLIAFGLFVEAVMRRALSDTAESEDDLIGITTDGEEEVYIDTVEDFGSDEHASKSRIVVPLIVLVVTLFFLIGGASVAGALDNAVHFNNTTVRPSWQSTLSVGQNTYRTEALFGSGPNTFGQQLLLFRNARVNLTQFWSTDFSTGIGFIPTSFVTTGIIGALAWLAFLGLFLFFGIRALVMRDIEDSFIRAVAGMSFVGMLFVIVELVFNIPGPIIIAIGLVLAGVFVSTLREIEPRGQRALSFSQNPRTGFIIAFLLTLFLLASVVVAYRVTGNYLAQTSLARAENALASGNLSAAATAANQSLRYAPSDTAYRLKAAINVTQINKIVQKGLKDKAKVNTKQLQTLFAEGIALAQAATKNNSHTYENWIALGNVYYAAVPLGVPGSYAAAKKAYEKAQTLNPTSPRITFTLAQLALTNKKYTDAGTFLTKTVSLKPNYTPAILELAQVDAQLGKAKEALKAAESAAYFIPNNPAVLFQVGVLRLETKDTAGAVLALARAVFLNPSYANARYFLAVAYAKQGKYTKALTEIKAIAALSPKNAKAVSQVQKVLANNKNPFVQNAVGTPLPSAQLKK